MNIKDIKEGQKQFKKLTEGEKIITYAIYKQGETLKNIELLCLVTIVLLIIAFFTK